MRVPLLFKEQIVNNDKLKKYTFTKLPLLRLELVWPSVVENSEGVADPGWLMLNCWDAKSADEALRNHCAVHELHVSSDPSAGPSTVNKVALLLLAEPPVSDSL